MSDAARQRMFGQALWDPTDEQPEDVVRRLGAMQSQEHAYARWSVAQRTTGPSASAVDAAFDDGRILRTHVLRPTWHYVAADDFDWLLALSGPLVDGRNAKRYADLGLDARTRVRATEVITRAVTDEHLTRRELAGVLERARISVEGQRLPHLLMHAELQGAICSGPMRGKEHTYAAVDRRVPKTRRHECSRPRRRDEALAELATRYMATRSPATEKDFRWWSGLPAADARQGLEDARAVVEPRPRTARRPRADLVQCYDEIVISYSETRAVLSGAGVAFAVPRHIEGFTHLVLLDGHLLGHWRLARDTTVETRLARSVDATEQAAIDAAVARYREFASS